MRYLVVVMMTALLLTFTLADDRTKRDADDMEDGEDESDEDDDDDRRRTTTVPISSTPWSYEGMPCTDGYQCSYSMCCLQPSPSEPATCQYRGSSDTVCDTRVMLDNRPIISEVVTLPYCPCLFYYSCLPSTEPTLPPNTGYCDPLDYYLG